MQFAPGKHRFEHIARVHGAVRLARTHDRVQFIYEKNDLSVAVLHIIQHRLQTFLKLAAVFRAGNQRAHIQRENLLVFEPLRHVSSDDTLRKSFRHRGFTDTGLADEHRIVFRLAGQDTDHVADLIVSADDRIKLLASGFFHQILSVLLQRVISRLRIVGSYPLVPPHRRQSLQETFLRNAELPEDLLDLPVRVL